MHRERIRKLQLPGHLLSCLQHQDLALLKLSLVPTGQHQSHMAASMIKVYINHRSKKDAKIQKFKQILRKKFLGISRNQCKFMHREKKPCDVHRLPVRRPQNKKFHKQKELNFQYRWQRNTIQKHIRENIRVR